MSSPRLEQLYNFLSESPGDPFICFAIAKEYEKLNQPQNALTQYLELLEQHPDYVGTYYHLGKLYESLEETPKALEIYSKGMAAAKKQKDQHALGELAAAKSYLEDG